VVRKHRLWETYLITHADIAPGNVDWGADEIEHVLAATRPAGMPQSPHELAIAEKDI
jgi:manganese/zinc/iron transport system permease protein